MTYRPDFIDRRYSTRYSRLGFAQQLFDGHCNVVKTVEGAITGHGAHHVNARNLESSDGR